MPIRIFIDQGHNPKGVNAGAEGFGLREQVNYAVGMELARLLNSDPRFVARVSRTTPHREPGRQQRRQLAAAGADGQFLARGLLCQHPLQRQHKPRCQRHRGVRLPAAHPGLLAGPARAQRRGGSRGHQGQRRPPKPQPLCAAPHRHAAILVELAYLTNGNDALKLRDEQPAFARGIYNGILSYFGFAPQ